MASRFIELNQTSSHGNLSFRLKHVNVSFANAVRRTILSNIPTVVFDTTEFVENTSKINNEMIKDRLSAIPIHIHCIDQPFLDKIVVEVKQENTGDTLSYVTTEHFQLVTDEAGLIRDDIFPINELTSQYIDVIRLLPHISDQIPVAKIHFRCKLKAGTAKQNSNYNVVSTCSYTNTLDAEKIEATLSKKRAEWKEKQLEQAAIELHEADFHALERHRYFLNNSFDFGIKSVGVYSNQQIMNLCCKYLIETLEALKYDILETIQNSFEVTLHGEDYTIGKMIEYCLHNALYENSAQLFFCGFVKEHPHDQNSKIKLTYKRKRLLTDVKSDFAEAIKSCIEVLAEIKKGFE